MMGVVQFAYCSSQRIELIVDVMANILIHPDVFKIVDEYTEYCFHDEYFYVIVLWLRVLF